MFTQLNLIDNTDYKVEHRSYFENEGDRTTRIKKSFLEDEVFTVLRMNPLLLPIGIIQLIPPANYIQLKHLQLQSFKAITSLTSYDKKEVSGKNLMEYKMEYAQLKRSMSIKTRFLSPLLESTLSMKCSIMLLNSDMVRK